MKIQDLSAFPGADLIEEGLRDLTEARESIPSLLVRIGRPRLERLGLEVPAKPPMERDDDLPEHRLYHLLAATNPDSAHSRYNALIRRLVSFERAAECAGR
jgi:hypothetical protein